MRVRLLAGVLALGLTMTACSGGSSAQEATPTAASSGGTVRLAINAWVGFEANAYVLKYLLEHELGYKVQTLEKNGPDSWKGFANDTVDVLMENWAHAELKKEYIDEKKVAVSAGVTGNRGVIGWYVPEWMAVKYPDITDWRNLTKYQSLFRTAKTGELGQFLGSDPTFLTNDAALIKNLNLPYKVVYAGSEAAVISQVKKATAEKKPLLLYFYEPQYLFYELKLVKINLPPYAIGCDADAKKVACDYPPYLLDKIVSKKFATTGGKAYDLVKNFVWTNDDQNSVAYDIAVNKMSPQAAAQKWVEANKIVWQAWIQS